MPYQTADILLNKYRLETLIGQGAFAEVYLATHLALQSPRALKVMRRNAPGVGSADYGRCRDRFQLEAQLSAQLHHPTLQPGLLLIYDFEQAEDSLVLVMEYAPNGNLAAVMDRARSDSQVMIPVEAVIQVGLEVAEGLAILHARDVVHRDLKPANILFDAAGRAKVADLGLAQVPGGPSQRSLLSQEALAPGGHLPHPGTPEYMSPEQESSPRPVTPASDVYALGLILFEMLTKRLYKYVRVGTRVRPIRPETPEWLDELVMQMLSEDPRQRPVDGSEVADRIRPHWNQMDVKRKQVQTWERDMEKRLARLPELLLALESARYAKNRPKLAEAAQAILLIDPIPEEVRDLARAAAADGYGWEDDYFHHVDFQPVLDELNQAIIFNPNQPDYYWLCGVIHIWRSHFQEKDEWEQALADYNRAIELAPDRSIYLWYRGDGLYIAAFRQQPVGNYDQAIADCTRAIELDPARPEIYRDRSECYNVREDYARAIADVSKAIDLDPGNAFYWGQRSDFHFAKGEYDRAIADATRAIELDPDESRYYFSRAASYSTTNTFDRAQVDFSQAIQLNPGEARSYHWRGMSYFLNGDFDRSLADFTKAVELDPANAGHYSTRAIYFTERNDPNRAIADHNKAIELDPTEALFWFRRAVFYRRRRDFPHAVADVNKAIELDPTNPEYRDFRKSIG